MLKDIILGADKNYIDYIKKFNVGKLALESINNKVDFIYRFGFGQKPHQ